MITIRQAQRTDQWLIRSLIYRELLNPLDLNWRRFLIAEADGVRAGIVQVRQHRDGSRELASLAVKRSLQGYGVGGALIKALLKREDGPLYLMCRRELAGYYSRFGFQQVSKTDMPPYFQRTAQLASNVDPLMRLIGKQGTLAIMRHPCRSAIIEPGPSQVM